MVKVPKAQREVYLTNDGIGDEQTNMAVARRNE